MPLRISPSTPPCTHHRESVFSSSRAARGTHHQEKLPKLFHQVFLVDLGLDFGIDLGWQAKEFDKADCCVLIKSIG